MNEARQGKVRDRNSGLADQLREIDQFFTDPSRFEGSDIHAPEGYAKRRGCFSFDSKLCAEAERLLFAVSAGLGRVGRAEHAAEVLSDDVLVSGMRTLCLHLSFNAC